MRTFAGTILIAALVAVVVGYGAAHVMPTTTTSASREAALERIKRTGIIRCGYLVSPPYLFKDPNTGQMSGLAYELMQLIGKELSSRIEWTEETGWGTYHEGLNTNRYDLMCVPVWQSGIRAKAALLSRPVFYNSMFAIAREDDNRFDQGLQAINKPDVTVVFSDNDPTQDIYKSRFSLAKGLSLPQSADFSQRFVDVVTHKADIATENYDNIKRFNANSNQKVKIVGGNQPLRLFADVIPMQQNEFGLKAALDTAIEAVYNSGEAGAIIQKYAPSIEPAALGYVTVKP